MIYLPSDNSHAELVRVFRHIQEALNSKVPTTTVIDNSTTKTIVKKSDVGGSTPGSIDHNSTTGKQGGTTGQYYHLTASEYSNLVTHPAIRLSCGIVSAPTFTDNGDGSCTIGTGTYNLYSTSTLTGDPSQFVVSGGTFTLTDQSNNYLVVNYNGGSPAVQKITDVTVIDEQQIIPLFTVYRDGTNLHLIEWDSLGSGLVNKIHQSIVKTQRFRRESGLTLGESSGRVVTITSGITWVGAVKTNVPAIQSDTGTFYLYYHSAGNWTKTTVTQYNNTQYDDGTNLQTLPGGKYAVNYVYRSLDTLSQEAFVVLGSDAYNLQQAIASQPPTIPPVISAIAVLVGRIIVLSGATTATQIDSAFATQFAASPITDHNQLSNLQGGAANEYYHLTSAQYTALGTYAIDSTVVHNTGNETGLAGNKTWTGIHTFSNATASTSTTSGAVVVTGGIGIGGAVNIGSTLTAAGEIGRNSNAGTTAFFNATSAGTLRWKWGKNSNAESGSNTGANFDINRYNDAGLFLGTPISINRATGAVAFETKISQTPVAFASLPGGSAGDRAFVNNNSAGAAFGSAANGSGSTTYPVYHDGVSWKIG